MGKRGTSFFLPPKYSGLPICGRGSTTDGPVVEDFYVTPCPDPYDEVEGGHWTHKVIRYRLGSFLRKSYGSRESGEGFVLLTPCLDDTRTWTLFC